MDQKKVVVMALHDELESAYPPLNVAVGAASSGAEVILAFSRKGVNILDKRYIQFPQTILSTYQMQSAILVYLLFMNYWESRSKWAFSYTLWI